MAFRLIFIGLPGSGKSFLASQCVQKTNGVIISFAEDIYNLAEEVLRRPVDKSLPGDRRLLQLIGTEWGREGGTLESHIESVVTKNWNKEFGYQDIWVDAFIHKCNKISSDISIFNDDTRFYNELNKTHQQLNFLPIFVTCSEETRMWRLAKRGELIDPSKNPHKSEFMVNKFNSTVLKKALIPVICNSQSPCNISAPWIINFNEFLKLIEQNNNNISIIKACHIDEHINRLP